MADIKGSALPAATTPTGFDAIGVQGGASKKISLNLLAGAQVFNVKNYGAVGDGVTDDLIGIQAALTACGAAGGGTVYMPPGTYYVTNVLLVPANTVLCGAGMDATTILNPAGALAGKSVGADSIFATVGLVGVAGSGVRDLCIDHSTNATTANGIQLGSATGTLTTNCFVDSVRVKGYASHQYLIWNYRGQNNTISNNVCDGYVTPGAGTAQEAIEVFGGKNIQIIGNTVNLSGNGIYICEDTPPGTEVSDIFVSRNYVNGCRKGVLVSVASTARNIIVTDNILSNQEAAGINIAGDAANVAVENIVVSDNVVLSPTGYGIAIDSQGSNNWNAISVTGNAVSHILGAGSFGVHLAAPSVMFSGNYVYDAEGSLVRVKDKPDICVIGNTLDRSVKTGLELSACNNVTVRDNKITGYSLGSNSFYGLRVVSCTGARVLNNTFRFATSEVYAIECTGTNATISGNVPDYIPAYSSPFNNSGAGATPTTIRGYLESTGDVNGALIKGRVAIDVGYAGANNRPLFATQIWYNAAIAFDGYVFQIDEGLSAAGSKVFQIFGGAGGATPYLTVKKGGAVAIPFGVQVKEGSNCKQGVATLVGGTVVVSNTSVTANSRIMLTSQSDGGTPGFLRVSARTAGTSFTITSSSGTDTSVVAYEIFEPA